MNNFSIPMQRPGDSEMLSDMLSSRSYLELSHERPQEEAPTAGNKKNYNQFMGQPSPEIKDEPERRLRPRKKRTPPMAPEIPDQTENRNSAAPDRPARKRGRPRLDTVKDAAAIEERRLQIRRAQRTYRLKKEVTIQTLKSRVDSLEQTLENVADLLAQDANKSTSSVDYLSRTRELILAEINKTRSTEDHHHLEQSQSDRDVFGYEVSHTSNPPTQTNTPYNRPRSPSPLLNRILPTATIYTYSHQESNLSRRLHRFTLEHIYRWLTDPSTPPTQLTRVFSLVPCIHDMPGIRRSFRRTLQSEIGSSLEFVKMPYYTLGGAGKHFPRIKDGKPVFPVNIRRPGKILRRMERILDRGGIGDWDEDWSGDRGPAGVGVDVFMGDEERIRSLDLDGEWFDCHDVQGYLEFRGIVLDSALRLRVPGALVADLFGFEQSFSSVSSLYESDGATAEYSDVYTLDVECFFDLLLANLRILGRAPGFRVWDVDAALRGAISRRPFT